LIDPIQVMLLRKRKAPTRQLLPSISIATTGMLALLVWNSWAPAVVAAAPAPAPVALPTPAPVALPTPAPAALPAVTVRAKVTFYNPWDPACVEVEAWRDGRVAWKGRSVKDYPYGIAADWKQFPPGTRISVPGYQNGAYVTVDDGCGAARHARRHGRQPILDLRFPSDRSWGRRYLDVKVLFPKGFTPPASLKKWLAP
jgi:3D (Asp-Asp-Asp) domain-containing protein